MASVLGVMLLFLAGVKIGNVEYARQVWNEEQK